MMKVPDLIRDVAIKAGVDLGDNRESGMQVGTASAATPEMMHAYRTGDYNTIQRLTDQTSEDLNPIYGNIQNNAKGAFFQVTNPSDGVDYWMSIAGPADNPSGYMWIYCPQSPPAANGKDQGHVATAPVVQLGTYSTNTTQLGISNQIIDNSTITETAATIATMVMSTVTKFMQKRMGGAAVDVAAEEAVVEGGEALVAEEVVEAGIWVGIAGSFVPLLVGLVAGAAAFYLILFVVDFIYKTYKVAINIYNWDTSNSWIIEQDYTDNGDIDGGQDFKKITIPAPSNSIKMPSGMTIPTKDTIYQYASIIYQNDFKFFDGLGASLRIVSADGTTGFQLKYLCSRINDNTIGLKGGIDQSLGDYYKDRNTWASSGSYNTESTIPGFNVPISATTTALGGLTSQLYQYDVHIGLQPSDQFGGPRPAPPQRKPPTLPEKVVMPQPGQEIQLPSGKKAKVISLAL
ncbi:Fc.00g024150.m01.CDS01 [Cosmosporella sp. VM-42]